MSILTIQSHVVAGHVGNSAATFCIERSGIETWELDTLQFSNHTAAEGWRGDVFSVEHLRNVLAGLEHCSDYRQCQAVVSGYLGDASVGDVVLETVRAVRNANPQALYCCDTVMGDGGELYVGGAIPTFMKEKALKEADIITPNTYELGWLADMKVEGPEDAICAAKKLLAENARLKMVVSTGLKKGDGLSGLCITRGGIWEVLTPKANFNAEVCCGAGDMTTAIFIVNYVKTGSHVKALQMAVSAIYGLIARTVEMGRTDIALIEAQEEIVHPSELFPVTQIA